jgi:hypothetical protein
VVDHEQKIKGIITTDQISTLITRYWLTIKKIHPSKYTQLTRYWLIIK